MPVKPIPEGTQTLVPHLALSDCAKAIEFYKQAFGARENTACPCRTEKIIHADLTIGDSHLYVMDPPPGGNGPPSLAACVLIAPVDGRSPTPSSSAPSAPAPPCACRWPTCSGATVTAS